MDITFLRAMSYKEGVSNGSVMRDLQSPILVEKLNSNFRFILCSKHLTISWKFSRMIMFFEKGLSRKDNWQWDQKEEQWKIEDQKRKGHTLPYHTILSFHILRFLKRKLLRIPVYPKRMMRSELWHLNQSTYIEFPAKSVIILYELNWILLVEQWTLLNVIVNVDKFFTTSPKLMFLVEVLLGSRLEYLDCYDKRLVYLVNCHKFKKTVFRPTKWKLLCEIEYLLASIEEKVYTRQLL